MDTFPHDDHPLKYNENLPYADLLAGEAETALTEICRNIALCTEVEDYERGVYQNVNLLTRYLDLKHPLPRHTRAALARLFFDLIVTPGMDLALVDIWAGTCSRLISKKKKLDPEDLTLPWRPLYERVDRIMFPKSKEKRWPNNFIRSSSLLELIDCAKRFFAPSATKEILEEFLPKFSTLSFSDAIKAQGYLGHFLPVTVLRHSVPTELLAPDDNNAMSPKDYLPTIFSLWSIFTRSAIYDSQFADMVSRIAEENIEHLDQYGGVLFTQSQIKAVFTVCLRVMDLQVGNTRDGGGIAATTGYGESASRLDYSAAPGAYRLHKSPRTSKYLAGFIVYSIFPDGDSKVELSHTLTLLAELIQAVELYYHPVNRGSWSYFLTNFAKDLAYKFLKRWREEQEDSCRTSAQYRLTPEIRHKFVLILRHVAYLNMFGKNENLSTYWQYTLKYLALLEPGLIFPGLLERIYSALETVKEVHRTTSALGTLNRIALPLFSRDHYPAGGKHFLPLLKMTISGIDINDINKTIHTLLFIMTSFMTIPFRDLTKVNSLDDTVMDVDQTDLGTEPTREMEDDACRAITGGFEEWLSKFMLSVFSIFENLSNYENKKQGGNMEEKGVTLILLQTCDVVFGQLSDEMYDLALKRIADFIFEQVLPNAIRAAGMLCDSITSANPKKAAKILLPECIKRVLDELEQGAASVVSNSASSSPKESDSTFYWYQNILFSIVSSMGIEILNYKTEILKVTREMFTRCKSRRGIMWAGKLVRYCLRTMLDTYPKDFRSLPPHEWQSDDIMKNSHFLWGKGGDPANIQIDWHVPSEPEKDFAIEILETFLSPSLARLEELISDNPDIEKPTAKHELTQEFCRHLAIVRNCVIGSSIMVSDDGVEPHEEEEEEEEEEEREDLHFNLLSDKPLIAAFVFTDSNDPRTIKAKQYRRHVGELMHGIAVYIRTKHEDDIESLKIVIKIIRTFLTERGAVTQIVDRRRSIYAYKMYMEWFSLSYKQHPRNLLVRRVYFHHLQRLKQNDRNRRRATLHDDLLRDLVDMSLSYYAEIRKASQSALFLAPIYLQSAKKVVVPLLLDALQPKEEVENKEVHWNRMKGALYLLQTTGSMPFFMSCLRDWRFIPKFVLSLCLARHEDKLSIQNLIKNVRSDYAVWFIPLSLTTLPVDDTSQATQALHTCDQSLVRRMRAKVMERRNRNVESYRDLMDSLVKLAADPKTHWLVVDMAADFIELFIRPEMAPSAELVAFTNRCSVSELPDIRPIGNRLTIYLLHYIKTRTFAQGNVALLLTKTARNPLKREIETKNDGGNLARQLLDIQTKPVTRRNADRSYFLDNPVTGWYVWPKTYTAYKVRTDETQLPSVDEASVAAYEEFRKAFTSPEHWERLLAYMSAEQIPERFDTFRVSRVLLFSSIFVMYLDEPIEAVKEQLVALCASIEQKSHQRTAAELMAGIVRGTKAWPLSKIELLWAWLIPLLKNTLNKVTPDSSLYWEGFVRYCALRRDPRRIQPIIDLILEAEFNPTSDAASSEATKLHFVGTLIQTMEWRAVDLCRPLLDIYFENINHPYKQVRDNIGSNINNILQIQWIPSVPSVTLLLEQNNVSGKDGIDNISIELDKDGERRVKQVLAKLESSLKEVQSSDTKESSEYANVCKTVLVWLTRALRHWGLSSTVPYVQPFLPHIFQMLEEKDNQDVQSMAKNVLYYIVQLSSPPDLVARVMDEFTTILTTSSNWHIRIQALQVLPVFILKHLFVMSSEQLLRIMKLVSSMLEDSHIEVREVAAMTLAALVQYSQRDAIHSIRKDYSALVNTKLPRRQRDKETGRLVKPPGFQEAVLKKHAGVLGLSCLIKAFPYEEPEWMPEVLCQLAGCMSDSSEIQLTIRKTFSDFRLTRWDTWHEVKANFTEEQREILNDMFISPSYYA